MALCRPIGKRHVRVEGDKIKQRKNRSCPFIINTCAFRLALVNNSWINNNNNTNNNSVIARRPACRFKFHSPVLTLHSTRRPRPLFTSSTLSSSLTSSLILCLQTLCDPFCFRFFEGTPFYYHCYTHGKTYWRIPPDWTKGKLLLKNVRTLGSTRTAIQVRESRRIDKKYHCDIIIITSYFKYYIHRICVYADSSRIL